MHEAPPLMCCSQLQNGKVFVSDHDDVFVYDLKNLDCYKKQVLCNVVRNEQTIVCAQYSMDERFVLVSFNSVFQKKDKKLALFNAKTLQCLQHIPLIPDLISSSYDDLSTCTRIDCLNENNFLIEIEDFSVDNREAKCNRYFIVEIVI